MRRALCGARDRLIGVALWPGVGRWTVRTPHTGGARATRDADEPRTVRTACVALSLTFLLSPVKFFVTGRERSAGLSIVSCMCIDGLHVCNGLSMSIALEASR